jgi:hypothetical protein
LADSAPSTGTYKNIAIFQDSSNSTEMIFSGNSASLEIDGAIYLPDASLEFDGNLAPNSATSIIAQTLTYKNNKSAFTADGPTFAVPGQGAGEVQLFE